MTTMASIRKIWLDAKAKMKSKDWEKNTKLGRDDFGPDLETFEKLMESAEKKLTSARDDFKKAEAKCKLVCSTHANYKKKILEGAKSNYITKGEEKILQDALREVGSSLQVATAHVRASLTILQSIHGAIYSETDKL
jgi:hypothetical protein